MAMKMSKSLLAVHLSGNSMTQETKNKLLAMLLSTSDPKTSDSEVLVRALYLDFQEF
jgi:hypothetical protein